MKIEHSGAENIGRSGLNIHLFLKYFLEVFLYFYANQFEQNCNELYEIQVINKLNHF